MKLSIQQFDQYGETSRERHKLGFYTDKSPHNGQSWALVLLLHMVSRESVLLAVNSLRYAWESAK